MESPEDYDLTGIRGAEIFRDLAEGLKLKLNDGAIGEITANAGDGAVVFLRILSDPNNPDRVGEEEATFYADVEGVVDSGLKEGDK